MPSPTSLSAVRADAMARRDRGDLNSARVLLERALEAAAMTSGEDHPEVLVTAHLLAKFHRQSGDLSGARRVLENALYAGSHRHGDDHPMLLSISFDLAEIADELGNRHEARKHYHRIARFGPAAPGFDQQQVQAARAWLGPAAPPIAPVQGQPITLPAPEPIAATPPPARPPAPAPPPPPADSVVSQPLSSGEPLPRRVPSAPPVPLGQARPMEWEAAAEVEQTAAQGGGLGARLAASGAPVQNVQAQQPLPVQDGEGGGLPSLRTPAQRAQAAPPAQRATGRHSTPTVAPGQDSAAGTAYERAQPLAPGQDSATGTERGGAQPLAPGRDSAIGTEHGGAQPLAPGQDSAAGTRYGGARPLAAGQDYASASPVSPPAAPAVTQPATRPPVVPPIVVGRPIELPPPPPPPRRRGRGMLVTSLTAAAVAVVAAGVTVFLVLHPKGKEPDPLPTGPSGAATNVALLDRGDKVTLSWTDPSGGQAQPIVAGSREDEAPRRMGTPAKGATEYTLLSLNKTYEYCFTILLIYTVDDIRQSEQVCTNRKKATPSPTR